jgi:hypothetical protein
VAVIGAIVVLVTAPLVVQAGTYDYQVETRDELANELAWGNLSAETQTLITDALANGTIAVAPTWADGNPNVTTNRTYPASLPTEPHYDDERGPRRYKFVTVDDGRYIVVTARLNETTSTDAPEYLIDVTARDRTETIVRDWSALSDHARAVVSEARNRATVPVYASKPADFTGGYNPALGLTGLVVDRDEFVVVQGDTRTVIRVYTAELSFNLDGLYSAAFALGLLAMLPAGYRRLCRRLNDLTAAALVVGAAMAAMALVRIVFRQPPLDAPLKSLQVNQELSTVVLTGLLAGSVVAVLHSTQGDDASTADRPEDNPAVDPEDDTDTGAAPSTDDGQ